MFNPFKRKKDDTLATAAPIAPFRFNSGLLVKNGELSFIRGTAYDPSTETPVGAWGEVVIDGVEHYTSISLNGFTGKIEKAPAMALAQAMEMAKIKDAAELSAYIKATIKHSR